MLTGDHSWGRKLSECREDLEFIFEGPFYLNRCGQILGWDEEREYAGFRGLSEFQTSSGAALNRLEKTADTDKLYTLTES